MRLFSIALVATALALPGIAAACSAEGKAPTAGGGDTGGGANIAQSGAPLQRGSQLSFNGGQRTQSFSDAAFTNIGKPADPNAPYSTSLGTDPQPK